MDIPQITGAPTQSKTEAVGKKTEDGVEWMAAFASSKKAEPEETVDVSELNSIDSEISSEGDDPDFEGEEIETASATIHDTESEIILLESIAEKTSPNVTMLERDSDKTGQTPDPIGKIEHSTPDVVVLQEAIATLGVPEVKGVPVQTMALNERDKPTFIGGNSDEMSVAKTIIDAVSLMDAAKVNAVRGKENSIVDPADVGTEIKRHTELSDVLLDRRETAITTDQQLRKSDVPGERQQIANALTPLPVQTQSAILTGLEQVGLSMSPEGEGAIISQDRSGSSNAAATTSVSNAIAAAEAKPRAVMYQISQAVSESGMKDIELRLDPVELGKVRISMSVRDGQMVATIFAERPETLDLLRRNADDLRAEFSEQGLGDASLDFHQSDQNEGSNEPRQDQFSNFEADVMPSSEALLPQSISTSTGLDVRL
jgi:flagellar hook-length control protein FliK